VDRIKDALEAAKGESLPLQPRFMLRHSQEMQKKLSLLFCKLFHVLIIEL
jgi:hypothetical protein